jgi:hypothetical protein
MKFDPIKKQLIPSGGGGGASTFISLTDVPQNYTGASKKLVTVKTDETGLEFSANEEIIDKTYAELATLVSGSLLVVGQKYRLTDYYTKYIQPYRSVIKICENDFDNLPAGWDTVHDPTTNPTGCYEPLILTANTTSTFERKCTSTVYGTHELEYDFTMNACRTDVDWAGTDNDWYFGTRIRYNGNIYTPIVYNTSQTNAELTDTAVYKLIGSDADLTRPGLITKRTDTLNNVSFPHDYKRMVWARFAPSYELVDPNSFTSSTIETYAGNGVQGTFYQEDGSIYICRKNTTQATIIEDVNTCFNCIYNYNYPVRNVLYLFERIILPNDIEYKLAPNLSGYSEYYTIHDFVNGIEDSDNVINISFGPVTETSINQQLPKHLNIVISSTGYRGSNNNEFATDCFNNTFLEGLYSNFATDRLQNTRSYMGFGFNLIFIVCQNNIFCNLDTASSRVEYNKIFATMSFLISAGFNRNLINTIEKCVVGPNYFRNNNSGRVEKCWIAPDCTNNNAGTGFSTNSINGEFRYNDIGNDFYNNTTGLFKNNVVGKNVQSNIYGDGFENNIEADNTQNITYEANVKHSVDIGESIVTKPSSIAIGNGITLSQPYRYAYGKTLFGNQKDFPCRFLATETDYYTDDTELSAFIGLTDYLPSNTYGTFDVSYFRVGDTIEIYRLSDALSVLKTRITAIVGNTLSLLDAIPTFTPNGADPISLRINSMIEAHFSNTSDITDITIAPISYIDYLGNFVTNNIDFISGGMTFGGFYMEDGTDTTTLTTQNTYYPIIATFTGMAENNMTFQNSYEVKVLTAGKYLVNWSISGSVNNSDQTIEGIVLDGVSGTTPQYMTANVTRFKENGIIYTLGGTGILSCAKGDLIRLGLENEGANGTIVTINHANLTILKIGA